MMDLHYIENVEFMDGGHGHQRTAEIEHVKRWAEERGLALVPVVPSEEMASAFLSAPVGDESVDWFDEFKWQYRAMIAAATETK